jgi:hypothetical protein
MVATTKVKDLLWRVSGLLQDVDPQFNRWPETELVNWLNDAQLAITKYLPAACARVISQKLRAGTLQSIEAIIAADWKSDAGADGASTIYGVQPLDFICNMGADGLTPGDAIPPPKDRRILDTQRANWHSVVGTKVRQVVYNPATPLFFLVQPAVPTTGAAVWLRHALIAKPTLIPNTGTPGAEVYAYDGSSTLVISVDDVYGDDLVDYVCARAYTKNADFTANDSKAAFFTNRFLGSLNLRITALTGNNPNLTRLPFAPEPIGAAK